MILILGCDVKDYGDIEYKVEPSGKQVANMIDYDDFAACMEKVII